MLFLINEGSLYFITTGPTNYSSCLGSDLGIADPESSASPSPTSTQTANTTTNTFSTTDYSNTTTNTFSSTTDSFGPTPTTSNSSSNSSSNIGPIIGGAVGGGVGGVALIGFVVFFMYREKTRLQSRESQNLMTANPSSPFVATPTTAGFSPMGSVTPTGAAHYEIPQTVILYVRFLCLPSMTWLPMTWFPLLISRVYFGIQNPHDPSTFPRADGNTIPVPPMGRQPLV